MMPVEAVPRMVEHIRIGAARAGKVSVARDRRALPDLRDRRPRRRACGAARRIRTVFATSVYNRFVAWCGFDEEAREILTGWRRRIAAGSRRRDRRHG
jgi:hypothetical protein